MASWCLGIFLLSAQVGRPKAPFVICTLLICPDWREGPPSYRPQPTGRCELGFSLTPWSLLPPLLPPPLPSFSPFPLRLPSAKCPVRSTRYSYSRHPSFLLSQLSSRTHTHSSPPLSPRSHLSPHHVPFPLLHNLARFCASIRQPKHILSFSSSHPSFCRRLRIFGFWLSGQSIIGSDAWILGSPASRSLCSVGLNWIAFLWIGLLNSCLLAWIIHRQATTTDHLDCRLPICPRPSNSKSRLLPAVLPSTTRSCSFNSITTPDSPCPS
ncbi:hypothetical protein EDB80DRAFT_72325 [Ilyonectria destructans]|nr:hypothetical protein EDB80DRAFT_72325 [Ilyonectria destructans]